MNTAPQVPIKTALQLEENEQLRIKIARTRHAISDTYGPKQPTKFRRKLPGKRVWKDKSKQYATLQARMTVAEFNAKQKQKTLITKLFQNRKRHALTD